MSFSDESSVCREWGYATLSATFTNNQTTEKNYKIVKIVENLKASEPYKEQEIVPIGPGVPYVITHDQSNGSTVTFRVLREQTDGTFVKVAETTFGVVLCPNGPR